MRLLAFPQRNDFAALLFGMFVKSPVSASDSLSQDRDGHSKGMLRKCNVGDVALDAKFGRLFKKYARHTPLFPFSGKPNAGLDSAQILTVNELLGGLA